MIYTSCGGKVQKLLSILGFIRSGILVRAVETTMKITDVTATLHEVPVDVPLRDEVRHRRIPFVRVETDENIVGYGQTGDHWWHGVKSIINNEMAPVLNGMSPLETERIYDTLQKELNPRVQTGAWSSATSAVDIAMWDLKGKYYDEPVWRLLGGSKQSPPAYITFGLKSFSREQLAEVAKNFVEKGQDKLKMKVGVNDATDPAEDVKRIKAVRKAIGDNVELMIDANYEFSFNYALELCNYIEQEQLNLTWFEEPVYGNDEKLLRKIRERTRIPISAGQNEGHRFRHRKLIANEAVDISQPNVLYVGGFTEGKKVASLAQSYNLDIANGGGWPYQNMHLHAAMANGWRVEFHYVHWKLCEKIYQNPPQPEKGHITIDEKPGLGLEPDQEALKKFQI